MPQESASQSSSGPYPLIASPLHTLLVVVAGTLNAYRGWVFAAHARAGSAPGRPLLYLRTILFELLLLGVVVAGVRLRGASLQNIFGERWRSPAMALRDIGIGVALWFVALLVVSMLGSHSGPPDQSIRFLLPQTSVELALWMLLSAVAGLCEEAVFRGYLQRQFTALTKSAPAGILISAAAFGAVHAYQGWQRAAVISVSAILFGVVAQWCGTVRPGMFAHALQDSIAPLLIRLMRH
jgi:membrane protease YdiL (CAAX protease family)